jgi:hypothetical protein
VIKARIMREARRIAQTEVKSVLAGRHEGKRQLGRPRCRQHNVKIDIQEV